MKLAIFDIHCRHWIHPSIKFLLTWGAMILLPFLHKDKYTLILGALYISLLVLLFNLRIGRFMFLVWKLVKGFVFLFAILITIRYILNRFLDFATLVNAGIFIEVIVIGIIFASVTTTKDYVRTFGYIKALRGIAYAYRATIQLVEDMIDEIAVIRSRRLSFVRILPKLGEKYLIRAIKRAVIFDENCRLKGTMPWFKVM